MDEHAPDAEALATAEYVLHEADANNVIPNTAAMSVILADKQATERLAKAKTQKAREILSIAVENNLKEKSVNADPEAVKRAEELGRKLAGPEEKLADGKKNKLSKTAEEKEAEGLPFNQRDAAGKIEFVLDKAMKMFEKFSDILSSLGSKSLNSLAKIMASMKMEPAWIDFVRNIAGGDKAQLQSALKISGLALGKGDATKDAAAMETLKAGYKGEATKKHEAYKAEFALDPKNKPAPAVAPAVVTVAPGAPAVAAAPAVAPVAAPQPIDLEQYMGTTYTFEMYTGEWLPKALQGKKEMIATLKPNGKGQKLITLEALAAMKK